MRQALLAGATRVGGTPALLPGLGGPSGIAAIGITVPCARWPAARRPAARAPDLAARLGAVAGATRDGFGFSLGSAPSGSIDGTRDPATSTGATGSIRVGSGVDTDGDGIPDAWESDHGAPVAPAAPRHHRWQRRPPRHDHGLGLHRRPADGAGPPPIPATPAPDPPVDPTPVPTDPTETPRSDRQPTPADPRRRRIPCPPTRPRPDRPAGRSRAAR